MTTGSGGRDFDNVYSVASSMGCTSVFNSGNFCDFLFLFTGLGVGFFFYFLIFSSLGYCWLKDSGPFFSHLENSQPVISSNIASLPFHLILFFRNSIRMYLSASNSPSAPLLALWSFSLLPSGWMLHFCLPDCWFYPTLNMSGVYVLLSASHFSDYIFLFPIFPIGFLFYFMISCSFVWMVLCYI